MKTKFITLIVLSMFLGACAKQDMESYKNKTAAENEANRDSEDIRTKEMEARLLRLQNFYHSMAGTFKGTLPINEKTTTTVRFVFTPSLPIYDGDRIRTPDEVTFDLTNLALNIEQNSISKVGDDPFSVGCVYEGIKPNTEQGYVRISNTSCPVTFVVSLLSEETEGKQIRVESDLALERKKVSQGLIRGESIKVNKMQVEMRSIHRPDRYIFIVERVE